MELAEAQLAAQQSWDALQSCNEALEHAADCDQATGFLLRARVLAWRRDAPAARADLAAAKQAPCDLTAQQLSMAEDVEQLLTRLKQQDKAAASQLFRGMFR